MKWNQESDPYSKLKMESEVGFQNIKKKFILKLDLHDDKDKRKALKTVSTLRGIDSITINMKERTLTVVGIVDPINVVSKLRKFWSTDIVSVGPAKEPEKKEEPKKEEGKKDEAKKDDKKEGEKKEEATKDDPKKKEGGKDEEKKAAPLQLPLGMHMPYRPQQQPVGMLMPYRPYYPPNNTYYNHQPYHHNYQPHHHSIEENPNASCKSFW